MLFSSSVFLFLFLPIVLIVYYFILKKSRVLQNVFLLIVSLFFYAWGEPKFVLTMLLSIVMNYFFALIISMLDSKQRKKKLILILSIIFNLVILFIFKYLAFTIYNINNIFSLNFSIPNIVLPIGISFFTFQAMSYVIDIYRKDGEVQKNPLNVGLYISFFPQLIAGPIVRYQTVSDEIKNRHETFSDFSSGVIRFIVGLIKKVLLANSFACVADAAFQTDNISILFSWLGILSYALQIYFDFSAYSDMAIGLGRMFGFHFLENFDYPYISKSITEFWRRWHISLSSWFRDYVYIPLGGSRVKKGRLIFNLFVVWLLTGIWHGANWTFILWGLMYFVLLVFEKNSNFMSFSKKHPIISYCYTMFFVLIGWVFFRAYNLSSALEYICNLFGINGNPIIDNMFIKFMGQYYLFIIAGLLFSTPVIKKIEEKYNDKLLFKFCYYVIMLLLFFVSISYIVKGSYNPFIYFNF